jgi:hypothetical protein
MVTGWRYGLFYGMEGIEFSFLGDQRQMFCWCLALLFGET